MLFTNIALRGATLASCSTFFSAAIPAINNSILPVTSQEISATSTPIPASQTPGSTGACTSIEGKAMQTCFQWPQPGQPHPTAPATSSISQNATTSTSLGAQSETSSPSAATSLSNTTPSPSSSSIPTPESSTPVAAIPTSTSVPQCPASHLSHRSSSSLAIPIPISDNPNNTTLPASPPSSPLPSAPAPVSDCTWIIGAPLNSCFPWPKPTSRARAVEMGVEMSRAVARGAWPMTTFLTRVWEREGEGL